MLERLFELLGWRIDKNCPDGWGFGFVITIAVGGVAVRHSAQGVRIGMFPPSSVLYSEIEVGESI